MKNSLGIERVTIQRMRIFTEVRETNLKNLDWKSG